MAGMIRILEAPGWQLPGVLLLLGRGGRPGARPNLGIVLVLRRYRILCVPAQHLYSDQCSTSVVGLLNQCSAKTETA